MSQYTNEILRRSMKIKLQLMVMFVLTCSFAVVGQTSMSSDSSMKKSDSMGKQMTMTGCVSEKDGKYMLTDKKHPNGVELMSSEDLKPHVGHKVSVTGMMDDNSMSGDSMSNHNMAMSGFKVNSMKMVSDRCSMPNAMMNK
jgi:hypothetical protein